MRGKDLQPSELKIMNIVWQEHPIPAKRIVQLLTPETGWSKNTIYTLTTRIIAKGFIRRTDPGFVCEPLVTREEVQRRENQSLLNRLYGGSAALLFARMLGDSALKKDEITELRNLLAEAEKNAE